MELSGFSSQNSRHKTSQLDCLPADPVHGQPVGVPQCGHGGDLGAVLPLVPTADLPQGRAPGGDVRPEEALGLPVEVDGDGVGLVVHDDVGGAVEGGELDVVPVGEEHAHRDLGVRLAVGRVVGGRDYGIKIQFYLVRSAKRFTK